MQTSGHLHRAHGAALDHHLRQLGSGGVQSGLGPEHHPRHGQCGTARPLQMKPPLLGVALGPGGNKIISSLRERIKKEKIQDEEDVKQALREEMQKILDVTDIGLHLNTKPSVILVVGVNGVGKTTSIGKMANRLAKDGKKVVVAAADTFRAAAVEQLEIWAKRAGHLEPESLY